MENSFSLSLLSPFFSVSISFPLSPFSSSPSPPSFSVSVSVSISLFLSLSLSLSPSSDLHYPSPKFLVSVLPPGPNSTYLFLQGDQPLLHGARPLHTVHVQQTHHGVHSDTGQNRQALGTLTIIGNTIPQLQKAPANPTAQVWHATGSHANTVS